MRTFILSLLIIFTFTVEAFLIVTTLTIYLIAITTLSDKLMTQKLIDKL